MEAAEKVQNLGIPMWLFLFLSFYEDGFDDQVISYILFNQYLNLRHCGIAFCYRGLKHRTGAPKRWRRRQDVRVAEERLAGRRV